MTARTLERDDYVMTVTEPGETLPTSETCGRFGDVSAARSAYLVAALEDGAVLDATADRRENTYTGLPDVTLTYPDGARFVVAVDPEVGG